MRGVDGDSSCLCRSWGVACASARAPSRALACDRVLTCVCVPRRAAVAQLEKSSDASKEALRAKWNEDATLAHAAAEVKAFNAQLLWKKHIDKKTGNAYYENTETGAVQWSAPSLVPGFDHAAVTREVTFGEMQEKLTASRCGSCPSPPLVRD